jgi:hypothetical protein
MVACNKCYIEMNDEDYYGEGFCIECSYDLASEEGLFDDDYVLYEEDDFLDVDFTEELEDYE